MSWKTSLDKFLTTPPEDPYSDYSELVIDKFTEHFFDLNEDWIMDDNGICNKWITKLFNEGKSSEDAVCIIERAFELYAVFTQEPK